MPTSLQPYLVAVFTRRNANIFVACLVAGFVFHAGYIVSFFRHPFAHSGLSSITQSTDGSERVNSIISASLFKKDDAVPAASAAPAQALKVLGIFADTRKGISYVILQRGGQPEKSYRVGDAVGDGLKIMSIEVDRVIVDDGASRTILLLRENQK